MSYCIRNKPWQDLLLKITLEIFGVNAEELDKKYQFLQLTICYVYLFFILVYFINKPARVLVPNLHGYYDW